MTADSPAGALPGAQTAGAGTATLRLPGLHAVITGASRGIGAVIAATLAAEGVRVSLLGRDAEALRRVAEGLGGDGPALAITTDVTDSESVQAAFTKADRKRHV